MTIATRKKAAREKALAKKKLLEAHKRTPVNLRGAMWTGCTDHDAIVGHVKTQPRTIRKLPGKDAATWTAGSILPPRGIYSFRVRIDETQDNTGTLMLGVADTAGTFACVLNPSTGMLHFFRNKGGKSPLEGWSPTEDALRTLVDIEGAPCKLRGAARGMIVECIVDADRGCIAFRAGKEGKFMPATNVLLPWASVLPNDMLRICVGLTSAGDQVTLVDGHTVDRKVPGGGPVPTGAGRKRGRGQALLSSHRAEVRV